MKKKGNICDCTHQRDIELCATYRNIISEATYIYLPDILRKVAESPASRFFVSEQRAYLVISQWRKSGVLSVTTPLRRRMFEDIWEIASDLMTQNQELSLYDAVFEAVNSPAPSFYLTPGSTRTLIYRALNLI